MLDATSFCRKLTRFMYCSRLSVRLSITANARLQVGCQLEAGKGMALAQAKPRVWWGVPPFSGRQHGDAVRGLTGEEAIGYWLLAIGSLDAPAARSMEP